VVPYFGTWPRWFPAYLQSCRYNPSIRWIFFTDCEIPGAVPDNAEFHRSSLSGFEKLFQRKTGIRTSVAMPYKLCDYKPSFGLVFEDYLGGFDFWGTCDVDVIWGNLRKFFATDDVLTANDVISPRRKKITGTCNLYRNTDWVNRLFLADRNFKFVLREREMIRYGEKRWKRFIARQAADGALRVHWPKVMHPLKLHPSAEWYWERGALFDCTGKWYWGAAEKDLFDYPHEVPGEVMYLDLRQWKRDSTVTCDFGYDDDPTSFHIRCTGISTAQRTLEESPSKSRPQAA
jgi:hypothetical protein